MKLPRSLPLNPRRRARVLRARRRRSKLIERIGIAVSVALTAAVAELITFNEVPTQPVDGLNVKGVTFGFTVNGTPSTNANFNVQGPNPALVTLVNPPVLSGTTNGILTLDFAQPIGELQFGLALFSFNTLPSAFNVQLFSPTLVSLGLNSFGTAPSFTGGLSEARYSYSGAAASRAVIGYNPVGTLFFAIDNLSFTPIPEPSTAIAGLLLLGFSGSSRLRRGGADRP